jgi:AcrR family transcriptional regulator
MMNPSMSTPQPLELPVLDAEPRERADAARNRQRILCAAQRLFDEQGVDCVSMDAIAAAAGVGKGTLFRRFGDRASLVRALLEEREAAFQEDFIRGAPPLGPGAPPADRLTAFGHAVLDTIALVGPLLLEAETGGVGRRFRTRVYGAYRAHVRALVRAGAPELDADYCADALLAALAAELVMYQLRGREIPLGDLRTGWESLARRVLG